MVNIAVQWQLSRYYVIAPGCNENSGARCSQWQANLQSDVSCTRSLAYITRLTPCRRCLFGRSVHRLRFFTALVSICVTSPSILFVFMRAHVLGSLLLSSALVAGPNMATCFRLLPIARDLGRWSSVSHQLGVVFVGVPSK